MVHLHLQACLLTHRLVYTPGTLTALEIGLSRSPGK